MVLAGAGGVDHGKLCSLAEKYFAKVSERGEYFAKVRERGEYFAKVRERGKYILPR